MTRQVGPGVCRVCALPEADLVQVDLVLASDPTDWPATLMEGFEPPDGILPPNWRHWGAVRMAQEWLRQRGRVIQRTVIETHYKAHLSAYPSHVDALVAQGTLSDGSALPTAPDPLPLVEDHRVYFRESLHAGRAALLLLMARIEQGEAPGGTPVATAVLVEVARLGARLAASQATLVVSRGARFHADEEELDDTLDGFMGQRPGPRFGDVRIREVDGETRAIPDEGPKDRADYNARAIAIGAPTLPV